MRAAPRRFAEGGGRRTSQLDQLIAILRGGSTSIVGLIALLVLLFAAFSFFMPATFPRATTLQAMMFQIPELGLLSLAMALPLISGGINLAIIATANQASLLMAWILTAVMPAHAEGATLAVWLFGALAAGLLSCICVGVITGLMVAVIGIHPILVTLGTMTLLHGLSIYFTRGRTLSGFPDALIVISNKTIAGIPLSFVVFASRRRRRTRSADTNRARHTHPYDRLESGGRPVTLASTRAASRFGSILSRAFYAGLPRSS